MSANFLASVVGALRFSPVAPEMHFDSGRKGRALFDYSTREWSRNIGVLDRCGLTLPLYARLLQNGASARLSSPIAAALEQRKRDNERRMSAMLIRFDEAVTALRRAGVRCVCVKGFSVVPEYVEELWQRHQIDFDFLIEPDQGLRAQLALEELGFRLVAINGDERRLRIPVPRPLAHNAYLYAQQEGAAIELHSHFWEHVDYAPSFRFPEDAFEHVEGHEVGSTAFLRLSPHYAFLYQVLHVFRHFLGSWARLLWLYEIAAYMHRHRNEDALWKKVHTLISSDTRLEQSVALVLLTAQKLFGCSIPPALISSCTLPADSPVSLWIGRYARRWLFTDMPGNKLNLLLQRHLIPDRSAWRSYLVSRLAPLGKRPVLCEAIERTAALSIAYRVANLRFQAARLWHHLSSSAEYAVARIDWQLHLRSARNGVIVHDLRGSEL